MNHPYQKINHVLDTLYIGDENSVQDSVFETYQIDTVISCMKNPPKVSSGQEQHIIEIDDDEECYLKPYFSQIADLIQDRIEQKKGVLVHCAAGISRSATMVIAFLMLKRNMPFDEAYVFLKSKRKYVWPNDGFIYQLKQL